MRPDSIDRSPEQAAGGITRRHGGGGNGASRLGPVECTLLALIALGIAVTVVMAMINP